MAIKTSVKKKDEYKIDDVKVTENKKKTNKNKKNVKKPNKKDNFFKKVIKEIKNITWPTKKMMLNYTIATFIFCIFFGLFFFLCDILFLLVKGLFS